MASVLVSLTSAGRRVVELGRDAWSALIARRKGHIDPRTLRLLAILACVPLLMALARILAFPGMRIPEWLGGDALRVLGGLLNRWLSLEWVPPDDRWAILYILLLPTAALLIALARLTFGLRVLGFRAILIAVGFQEIGILPSLFLMAVVVATILVLRPPMRRMQLPFYARIAVILCISAMIMVCGLFLGPWLRSDTLWSFAFFPVIILAMLAESIAGTLARDDAWTAAWRAGWTVVLALLIALVSWIPAVREVALRFPELMLTQLVAIVFISEFLDLRLLEHWPAALVRGARAARPQSPKGLKVAVVQNRWNTSVIGRLGVAASPRNRTRSVQVIADGLREQGFTVKVFEADISLLRQLREFLPAEPLSGAPGGLVLNLAAGVQGQGRFCHLPAMLEMAGVAYTGPDPIAQARVLDRYAFLTLLRRAGVPTPRFELLAGTSGDSGDLRFPLVVRPRYEPDDGRTVVKDRRALDKALERIRQRYAQDALIETAAKGSEIRVALLGNENIECMPLLEVGAAGSVRKCPASIEGALADRIRECARAAYAAVGCRDYARVDVRLTGRGDPQVVGVHSVGIFARRGSFAQAAERGGYPFRKLMRRVVDLAWERYRAEPVPRPEKVARPVVAHLEQRTAVK